LSGLATSDALALGSDIAAIAMSIKLAMLFAAVFLVLF
jgi:hypothetical protein